MLRVRFKTGAVLVVTVLAFLLIAGYLSGFSSPAAQHAHGNQHLISDDTLPCTRFNGSTGIVIVMRTGATEIEDKLPIHLDTTFRCYADVIIFSDFAETFRGHRVYDALATLDDRIKQANQDFDLYRRLQSGGRASLGHDELSGSDSYEGSKSGKPENAGWRLDKWKFLPMLQQTLDLRPEGKFYVFVESDTYVVWSNLVQWLQKVDPSRPAYYGSKARIGDDLFAHGGSTVVLTKPALQKAADEYADRIDTWNQRTADHWAGDAMLGNVLREAGVKLTAASPMIQGSNPWDMPWEDRNALRNLWCAPALSYHHLNSGEVQRLWEFEQYWLEDGRDSVEWNTHGAMLLHHKDVLRDLILPLFGTERADWDNSSPDPQERTDLASLEGCRTLCKANQTCYQYSWGDGHCATSAAMKSGHRTEGIISGWVTERVSAWMKSLDKCKGKQSWTVT